LPARFPPAIRLRARHEFTSVQERGRRVATKLMTVLGQPNAGPADRLGIIASRRLGDAVTRNRAKRRVREVFRHTTAAPTETRATTLDLVVIPRREMIGAPISAVEAEFLTAVRRLRGNR
jgi:ribonuclease P protein component